MYGRGKCETHPSSVSSFDAETFGALYLTQELLDVVPKRKWHPELHFIMIIDNEAVIKTINQCINGNIIHPMTPCYEIFMKIKSKLITLGFKGLWKWVRSHQKETNGRDEWFNNKVDTLANKYRVNKTPRIKLFPLTASHFTTYHNNRPIFSNMFEIIKESATKEESQSYLKRKFQWEEYNLEEVDWSLFSLAIKRRKLLNKITTIKKHFWMEQHRRPERMNKRPRSKMPCVPDQNRRNRAHVHMQKTNPS